MAAPLSIHSDCVLTLLVTVHREGELAFRTLRPAYDALLCLSASKPVELLIIADRPDPLTLACATSFVTRGDMPARLLECDFGDVGPARNWGVSHARGKYVAFIDGDDLFSANWLPNAVAHAEVNPVSFVQHPQYTLFFCDDDYLMLHRSSNEQGFDALVLFDTCAWFSCFLANREFLLNFPFANTPRQSGFGSEDWHWYCEALAAGATICTVPDTCLFARRRPNSRSSDHDLSQAVLRPSKLFDPGSPLIQAKNSEAQKAPRELRRIAGRAMKIVGKQTMHQLRQVLSADRLRYAAGIAGILQRRFAPMFIGNKSWPTAITKAARAIHTFEPEIFPDSKTIASTSYRTMPIAPGLGREYRRLVEQLKLPLKHAILVPWLKKGGSDRTAINFAHALSRLGAGSETVVISTIQTDSPWADRLPDDVKFVDFGNDFKHLSIASQRQLLTRLFLDGHLRSVHCINSDLGYEIFNAHGLALSSCLSLYCSIFCSDYTQAGRSVGVNVTWLPKCMPYLTQIISDNRAEVDRLRSIYGFAADKFTVQYQPIDLPPTKQPEVRSEPRQGKRRILWAGRLDRQKRPDLLVNIAKAARNLDVEFHVYGTSLISADAMPVPKGPNIVYHGSFDGFAQIPAQQYDAYLYTSQWDGLPNILSEAMAAGLPVIASDVGGVGELIIDGQTGYLISPYDEVERYVVAIENLLREPITAAKFLEQGRDLLATRHSWTTFLHSVRALPNYLE